MDKKVQALNKSITDFIPTTDRQEFHKFEVRADKARVYISKNSRLSSDILFDLITTPQDGTYPLCPTFKTSQLAVQILWGLQNNTNELLAITDMGTAPWYVKTEALACLQSAEKEIAWPKVIQILENQNAENEIKKAALNLIISHDRREYLSYLKEITTDRDYLGRELQENIIFARASLGDTDVILPLLDYRNDPWSSTNRPADAAWTALANVLGGEHRIADVLADQLNLRPVENTESVWIQLQGHTNIAVVNWAISKAPKSMTQIENCLNLLSHAAWMIRNAAADWLIKYNVDPILISKILSDPLQPRIAQSWAAYVLLETMENPSVTLAPYLDNHVIFQTPWNFKSPKGVREAIINHYVPDRQTGTDIRYVLEHALKPVEQYSSAKINRDKLIVALRKQGLFIESCQSIGEANQQGGGTYWIIKISSETTHLRLDVCEIGKFVSCVHQSENYEFIDASPESHPAILACRTAAENLGFVWIRDEDLDPIVPDLNVYFFGSREPLPIRDLLFYWQD